jgi:hypothetical protein
MESAVPLAVFVFFGTQGDVFRVWTPCLSRRRRTGVTLTDPSSRNSRMSIAPALPASPMTSDDEDDDEEEAWERAVSVPELPPSGEVGESPRIVGAESDSRRESARESRPWESLPDIPGLEAAEQGDGGKRSSRWGLRGHDAV